MNVSLRGARRAAWSVPLIVLLLWEAIVHGLSIPPTEFPAPTAAAVQLARLFASGEMFRHLSVSLTRLFFALLLAAVPGVVLGMILGLFPPVRRVLDPFVALLYTIPKIAVLPLIVIVVGANETSVVLTASLSAFAQIIVSTMTGVMSIDPVLIEAGKNYGATGWRLYAKVVFPASLGPIWTGLRVGLGLGLILLIAIEFITSQTGLGYLVSRYWNVLALPEMYAAIFVAGLVGIVVSQGFVRLGKWIMPWAPHE